MPPCWRAVMMGSCPPVEPSPDQSYAPGYRNRAVGALAIVAILSAEYRLNMAALIEINDLSFSYPDGKRALSGSI